MQTGTRVGKTLPALALGIAMLGSQVASAQEDTLSRLQAEAAGSPQRLDLVVEIGNAAVAAGKLDLALSSFEKVLGQVDPASEGAADLLLRIGEVQRRTGDLPGAVESLSRASGIQPDSPVVTSTLAMVLEASGRTEEAIRAYRKGIQLDPENAIAMNNLALLLSEHGGDLDEALSLGRRAQRFLPLDPDVADTVGLICLKKHQSDEAIKAFGASIARDPDQPGVRYHMGLAYAQKGDRPAAIEQLNQALGGKLLPVEREKVRDLLATLEQ
ncbi:MAG: tetratricopeptide repeat protein [Candidatus Solibacter sp.]